MTWQAFRFADPWWLTAALAGPLVLLLAWLREKRGRAIAFPGLGRLGAVRRGWRTRLRHAPLVLGVAALMVAAVALARPQWGSARENTSTAGVDIVVSLDVSGSMAAEDFQPRNRLAVAKGVVADFMQRRTSDRVGLVIFAGQSLTKAPPTTDTAVLLHQLDDVRLGALPDGTAIGSGLATALSRLRHSKTKSRVVVLVTDGVNNAGEIDPVTASDLAAAMQVRVYTIGVGKGGQVPMPIQAQDPFTGQIVKRTAMVEVQIDEALLKRIAARTGGEFFRATDAGSLKAVFERIDRLEKSEIKQSAYRRYHELFPAVLSTAAGLLALAGILFLGGLRVAPV
jgi:Ca-activated chloride channel family protein